MNLIGMEMSCENFPLRMSSSQLGLVNMTHEVKQRSTGSDAVAPVCFVAQISCIRFQFLHVLTARN
jgi:hypothetical protein